MRQRLVQAARIARRVVPGAAVILVLTPGIASGDAGWSRNPGSGLAGASIQVASSSTTLCLWEQPTPDPSITPPATDTTTPPTEAAAASTFTTYDGTSVELRLVRDGVALQLGSLAVTAGGAWSGRFVVPAASEAPAGTYDLFARCVVDRPELDGIRSYDFDPLTFAVVESPPPTTVTIPPEIGDPATVANPGSAEVLGAQAARPEAANQAATTPTLPKTGDGTLAVALAGLAAVALGAGALWWGARSTRRPSVQPHPSD